MKRDSASFHLGAGKNEFAGVVEASLHGPVSNRFRLAAGFNHIAGLRPSCDPARTDTPSRIGTLQPAPQVLGCPSRPPAAARVTIRADDPRARLTGMSKSWTGRAGSRSALLGGT